MCRLWQVFYSIACVVSVVALYLQGRTLIEQLRFRREDTLVLTRANGTAVKLRKHTKRLISTQRTIKLVRESLVAPVSDCVRTSFG